MLPIPTSGRLSKPLVGCPHCRDLLDWYRTKGTFPLQYRCTVCGHSFQVAPRDLTRRKQTIA